ncbi:MAG: aminoacyl-tRNA hydrolase [Verrucomicrobiales bacterium]|nr:aminoacyl-tRNA hydrolase [Verrucomicrobiales bacterium]
MSEPETTKDGIRLVVGLGNPGVEYEHTRHNVGFDCLDLLASDLGLDWEKDKKSKALVARRGSDIILVKPQTFMNLSGRSVARLTGFYKIPKDGVLIVYDDVDTDPGKIKFKPKGSAGGHNGIKSIIECLGTDEFPRLKIGIGGSGGKGQMVGHVLGKFSEQEQPVIDESLQRAKESIKFAVEHGLHAAMNEFNRREKPAKKQVASSGERSAEESGD